MGSGRFGKPHEERGLGVTFCRRRLEERYDGLRRRSRIQSFERALVLLGGSVVREVACKRDATSANCATTANRPRGYTCDEHFG